MKMHKVSAARHKNILHHNRPNVEPPYNRRVHNRVPKINSLTDFFADSA